MELQIHDTQKNLTLSTSHLTLFQTDYLAYGEELTEPLQDNNGTILNRIGFTGHEHDYGTGFINMQARLQNPGTGKFLQPDPGYDYDQNDPMPFNLYSYVRGNPIGRTDPTGMVSRARKYYNNLTNRQIDEDEEKKNSQRAVQGTVAHAGVVLTNDGIQRKRYSNIAKTATSVQRNELKLEIRKKLSPLGKALSEKAANNPKRISNLASKTIEELALSSGKTNKTWNVAGKIGEVSGKGLLVVGAGMSVYNVATAPEREEMKIAAKETGAWIGALSFGEAGAKGGAFIGAWIGGGPIGAAVGAVVGGLGGAVAGAILGEKAGENIYNSVNNEDD